MTDSALTAAEARLVYQREIFINPAVTRHWVSIKVFDLPADIDDRTALALMIAHVRYRDSYAGTGHKDMVTIHGPYWLSAITPETFVVADPADTETLIRTWSEYYAPLPQTDREAMDREVYRRIATATVIYALPDRLTRGASAEEWVRWEHHRGLMAEAADVLRC